MRCTGLASLGCVAARPPGGILPPVNLQQLRRLDADAEAAVRRISIVTLTSTILIVFAVTLAAMLVLALVSR